MGRDDHGGGTSPEQGLRFSDGDMSIDLEAITNLQCLEEYIKPITGNTRIRVELDLASFKRANGDSIAGPSLFKKLKQQRTLF
jgi:hypothetical protein